MKNYFPLASIGLSHKVHYVDDYRYYPGRTVCGRDVQASAIFTTPTSPLVELFKACKTRDYPTESEWHEYHTCTDCGVSTIDESFMPIRQPIWEKAYPGYSSGVGVGSSRPCVECLEERLGRMLTPDDFLKGTLPVASQSARLRSRIIGDRTCVVVRLNCEPR